ncbi:MAG: hypothetical protein R2838_20755 [Caldilineaceae bacterium]
MNHSPRLAMILILVTLALAPRAAAAQDERFPPIPIAEIQGAGPASPLYQEWVDTVGVVTGVNADGFYLQDPQGDGDPATSDGVYVYTSAPRVGGRLRAAARRVRGRILREDRTLPGQVHRAQRRLCARRGNAGGPRFARLAENPVDLFEQYEGMLVRADDLVGVVQGPTKRFSNGEMEIAFIPEQWAPYVAGERVFQWQPDAMPALMYVSNGFGATLPDLNWGDRIALGPAPGADDAVIGVLDYNFGKYQLIPLPGARIEGIPAAADAPAPVHDATVPTPPGDGDLSADFTVCTFNLLGMGRGTAQNPEPDDYAGQMYKRARAIAETLDGCTVIGVQETGTPEDAQNLADLLATEFGLEYTATSIAGPGTESFEFPLTNSVLTRSDRVQVLAAESRQGCSRYNYDVRYIPGA